MERAEAKEELIEKIIRIHLVTVVIVVLISYFTNLLYGLLVAPFLLLSLAFYVAIREDYW